jgi:hypothetical protein
LILAPASSNSLVTEQCCTVKRRRYAIENFFLKLSPLTSSLDDTAGTTCLRCWKADAGAPPYYCTFMPALTVGRHGRHSRHSRRWSCLRGTETTLCGLPRGLPRGTPCGLAVVRQPEWSTGRARANTSCVDMYMYYTVAHNVQYCTVLCSTHRIHWTQACPSTEPAPSAPPALCGWVRQSWPDVADAARLQPRQGFQLHTRTSGVIA